MLCLFPGSIIALFFALAAIQFVVDGNAPMSSYATAMQILVLVRWAFSDSRHQTASDHHQIPAIMTASDLWRQGIHFHSALPIPDAELFLPKNVTTLCTRGCPLALPDDVVCQASYCTLVLIALTVLLVFYLTKIHSMAKK